MQKIQFKNTAGDIIGTYYNLIWVTYMAFSRTTTLNITQITDISNFLFFRTLFRLNKLRMI